MPSLQEKLPEFERHNTQVLGISVDSTFCHQEWAKTLGGITYPLLSDINRKASEAYGVLSDGYFAKRTCFIVDRAGKVRFKEAYEKGALPEPNKLLAVVKGLA